MPLAARLILGLFGTAVILLGLCLRLRQHLRITAAQQWPACQGQVLTACMLRLDDDESITFQPALRYRYPAGSVEYEGTRVNLLDAGRTVHREMAEAVLRRHVAGRPVQVFYNPANPGDACLELGPPVMRPLRLLALALPLCAAAVLWP